MPSFLAALVAVLLAAVAFAAGWAVCKRRARAYWTRRFANTLAGIQALNAVISAENARFDARMRALHAADGHPVGGR